MPFEVAWTCLQQREWSAGACMAWGRGLLHLALLLMCRSQAWGILCATCCAAVSVCTLRPRVVHGPDSMAACGPLRGGYVVRKAAVRPHARCEGRALLLVQALACLWWCYCCEPKHMAATCSVLRGGATWSTLVDMWMHCCGAGNRWCSELVKPYCRHKLEQYTTHQTCLQRP